ncbi:MAG: DMT family transporter [Treponema sp.]|nr:DMT family transporter [Treponema sp.]
MTERNRALAAVSATMLFWGFSFVSIKIAVGVFGPMTLGALRFFIAVVFLFFLKRVKAPEEKIKKEDIPLLAGAGLTGVTLYFFFENNGVARVPASEASIITAAIPVITLIAETLGVNFSNRKKEDRDSKNSGNNRESLLKKILFPGLGALVSMTGVGLVAGVSLALHGSAAGYLFLAGTCASWVIYCFLTPPLFERHSRIFVVFWQSAIGFIGFLPFAIFEKNPPMLGLLMHGAGNVDLWVWGHVVFLGIFCSAIGYWFYALALNELGVVSSSVFINFIPVISAIGGYFVLGERLRPLQILGAILVLAGVYVAVAGPRFKRKRERRN